MRVKWTDHALAQREQVASYICLQFGTKRKTLFLRDVREMTRLLRHSPNMGRIDPLFEDRPYAFRSVVINGLSKMVYRIDGETIYIVAFWDTRMEPEAQAAQVK